MSYSRWRRSGCGWRRTAKQIATKQPIRWLADRKQPRKSGPRSSSNSKFGPSRGIWKAAKASNPLSALENPASEGRPAGAGFCVLGTGKSDFHPSPRYNLAVSQLRRLAAATTIPTMNAARQENSSRSLSQSRAKAPSLPSRRYLWHPRHLWHPKTCCRPGPRLWNRELQ
jgi:hypothetical protein